MNDSTHWDRVYSTRSAQEVSWFQPHAQRSLELIGRVADGRPSAVIDVGGGASTLVDDLLQGPVSYTHLDVYKRQVCQRSMTDDCAPAHDIRVSCA